MADDQQLQKAVKIGVKQGGGPPPGYKWNVDLLDQAHSEAMGFLTEDQYVHMSRQVRELAMEEEPTRCPSVDVRHLADGMYEVRDKGGILCRVNARVFFFLEHETRTIVVLGAINKKNDGPTPDQTRILMRFRRRSYLTP